MQSANVPHCTPHIRSQESQRLLYIPNVSTPIFEIKFNNDKIATVIKAPQTNFLVQTKTVFQVHRVQKAVITAEDILGS